MDETSIKMMGIVSSIISLGVSLAGAGVGSITLMSGLTLGLGIAAIVAGIWAGSQAMNASMEKSKKKAEKLPLTSYNTLGPTEMVSLERGSAIFDQGESVVRTDNFEKLTDRMDKLINITDKKKFSFKVETHHQTRYR